MSRSVSPTSGRIFPVLTFRNRSRLNCEVTSSAGTSGLHTSPTGIAYRLPPFFGQKIYCYLCIFTTSFIVFFLLSTYSSAFSRLERTILPTGLSSQPRSNTQNVYRTSLPSRSSSSSPFSQSSPSPSASKSSRSGTVPVIYRTILDRLDRLENAQDALAKEPSNAESVPFLKTETEAFYSVEQPVSDACGDSPSPCRFLLPLRIAEQESKARIHLLEIIQTAKLLNRVLVLPHAGRSRLGACFRWSFEVYYDQDSLMRMLHDEGVRAVTLEAFKHWLDSNPWPSPRGQLLSLISKAPHDSERPNAKVDFDAVGDGLRISVDTQPIAFQDSRLPGCFAHRFGSLLSSDFTPITIYPSPALSKALRKQPIGDEFIAILDREDIKNASTRFLSSSSTATDSVSNPIDEPEVLMLDWGLRYPIYRHPFKGTITYSPSLSQFAKALSPVSPYLMIHWRMEGVSPNVLPDCAHDLVDTISRLLHDPNLGDAVERVWFAGDYPIPIADHISSPSPFPPYDHERTLVVPTPKSGTFRSFERKHAEAVNILVDAFRNGAELDKWAITDLANELARVKENVNGGSVVDDVNSEFLGDSGALGILDKMIGMDAALFVGGAKRCGRISSFTKQVIDARRVQQREGVQNRIRNVIEYFG